MRMRPRQKPLIEKHVVDKLLRDTIVEFPFSLFPYVHGKNSYQAQRLKQGDCVAMSIYLQRKLRRRGITSVLIPATIPERYSKPGYLDISHVALAVWSGDEIFICDPAFYFHESLAIAPESTEPKVGHHTNVYEDESKQFEYDIYLDQERNVLNLFQTIPANTYVIRCHESDNHWKYYLTEILNPDEAITTFFVNVKRHPFIAIVNKELSLSMLLRFLNDDTFVVKEHGNPIFEGNIDEVPEWLIDFFAPFISRETLNFSPPINNLAYFKDPKKRRNTTRKIKY